PEEVRVLSLRWDALGFLIVAAGMLAGVVLQAGVSPWRSNLFLVGALGFAILALGLVQADRGGPAAMLVPLIAAGVLLVPLGLLFSYWMFRDGIAQVLKLELRSEE